MHPSFFHRHGCGIFFGRHHRGFQGFGYGPGQMFRGDSGHGAGGIGAGRKLGAADLQLLILALLAEKPCHGYELIKAITERSNGYYSPSPGMVYPALTYLEELGHAAVEADGTKKRYSITAEGSDYLAAHRTAVDTLIAQLAWIGQRMDHVRRAFGDPGATDAPDDAREGRGRGDRGRGRGRGGDDSDFALEVRQARDALRAAVRAKVGASLDEQRRIAEILARAAREISGE